MEKLSFGEDREDSEKKLDERITKAYRAALPMSEYNDKLKKFKSLCKERDTGGLDADAETEYQSLHKQLEDCEIMVSSVMEYKRLLELIPIPKEEIDETLSHENAHANVAEQSPSIKFIGFVVRFYKDEEGKVCVWPSAEMNYQDVSFAEKQRLQEFILVNRAPLEYGAGPLSDRDEQNIREAEKRLAELDK